MYPAKIKEPGKEARSRRVDAVYTFLISILSINLPAIENPRLRKTSTTQMKYYNRIEVLGLGRRS
jgi:hypothetical protein